MAASSQIIPDKITQLTAAAGNNVAFAHTVSSQDCVMVILVAGVGTPPFAASVNGTNVPATITISNGTTNAAIFYYTSPPVGSAAVSVTSSGSISKAVTCVTLLGVNKAALFPITATGTGSTAFNTNVQVTEANALILDIIADANLDTLVPSQSDQTVLVQTPVSGVLGGAASYKVTSPGLQTVGWTGVTGASAEALIVLEAAHAPSIAFPIIDTRNINDIVGPAGLATSKLATSGVLTTAGNYSTEFWQNSFLHTIGRVLSPPQAFSLVAETELQTSQIVIDKITQSALTSATTITVDHNVTSQDAVVLFFASQIGVVQGFASVTFNGTTLKPLIGANLIGTIKGSTYYTISPEVGINVISANVALPASLELVVITLLGVNKKALNPVTATNSSLTGSPSSTIQATSANSLIIDYVGSLGTSIAEDTSQTVYLDQPQSASETAGSIKLSNMGIQTMAWTTASATWVQMVVALEPANALSMWYPAVNMRNLSDVIQVNSLDDSTNPVGNFFQAYGAYPSTFYQNSFLHTVGRTTQAALPVTAQQPLELQLLGVG